MIFIPSRLYISRYINALCLGIFSWNKVIAPCLLLPTENTITPTWKWTHFLMTSSTQEYAPSLTSVRLYTAGERSVLTTNDGLASATVFYSPKGDEFYALRIYLPSLVAAFETASPQLQPRFWIEQLGMGGWLKYTRDGNLNLSGCLFRRRESDTYDAKSFSYTPLPYGMREDFLFWHGLNQVLIVTNLLDSGLDVYINGARQPRRMFTVLEAGALGYRIDFAGSMIVINPNEASFAGVPVTCWCDHRYFEYQYLNEHERVIITDSVF